MKKPVKDLRISIYASDSEALDKYTVLIETGFLTDFYAMCDRPNSATGVNLYLGQGGWTIGGIGLKRGKHLGQNIGWDGAPEPVKAAILDRLRGY